MSDEPVLDLRADKCVSSIGCCDSHICTCVVRLLGLLYADQLKYGTHQTHDLLDADPADEKEGRPAKRLNLPRDSRDNEQVSFRRYNCSKCLRIVVRR